MLTRELLKQEIDKVQEEYLIPLYKIIKTFEQPRIHDLEKESKKKEYEKKEWLKFLDKYAGSLADTPIERGKQGNFEKGDDECK